MDSTSTDTDVKPVSFNDTRPGAAIHIPDLAANCRCGCVPPNMMSLFQMAELRAKHREKMRLAAASAPPTSEGTEAASNTSSEIKGP